MSISKEGRATPHQLQISRNNLEEYKKIIDLVKGECIKTNGFEPIIILQATHGGRYSNPTGMPEPLVAFNNPYLEKAGPIHSSRIIRDDKLAELEEQFGKAAKMAEDAGFDGVDIKACHMYLACELLSAHLRPGRYGGDFTNRSRFLINSLLSAKAATKANFITTTRLNIYDGFPYPYGFGVGRDGSLDPDMAEPGMLIERLNRELGVALFNLSMGNPYVNPHITRPYNKGNYIPEEHPLFGIARILNCTGELQKRFPDVNIVCSGLSYLRRFSVYAAAGMLEQGYSKFAGFGREALAYPSFPRDLKEEGFIQAKKCCLTCGKCTYLLRSKRATGCVLRDREVYLPIYQETLKEEERLWIKR